MNVYPVAVRPQLLTRNVSSYGCSFPGTAWWPYRASVALIPAEREAEVLKSLHAAGCMASQSAPSLC